MSVFIGQSLCRLQYSINVKKNKLQTALLGGWSAVNPREQSRAHVGHSEQLAIECIKETSATTCIARGASGNCTCCT